VTYARGAVVADPMLVTHSLDDYDLGFFVRRMIENDDIQPKVDTR
jgi:hypothetical protein